MPTRPIPAAPPLADDRKPDIVLVTIDALRADHLPFYGHTRATAPHLSALASRSVVFDHAFTHATETQTAMPALLTGRVPAGPVWEEVPSGEGLAERLKRAGYRTGAFVGNAWLTPERGYSRGFDRFVALDYVYPTPETKSPGQAEGSRGHRIDGGDLVRAARSFLQKSRKPTFVWLHLMDVHNPYRAPPPFEGLFSGPGGTDRYVNGPMPMSLEPQDLTYLRDRYDEGIRHTDALLEPLWRDLEAGHRRDHTLVVVTADHGEEFGEHGGLGHGTSLHLEQLRVPLLVQLPAGVGAGLRIAREVALWDVVPTVLGAVGALTQQALTQQALTQQARTQQALTQQARTQQALTQRLNTQRPDTSSQDRREDPATSTAPPATVLSSDGGIAFDGLDLRGLIPEQAVSARGAGGADDRMIVAAVQSLFGGMVYLSALQGPDHLIVQPAQGSRQLFRWREDPLEKRGLLPGAAPRALELEAILTRHFATRGGRQPARPIVTGRRPQLDALGYVGTP